MANLLTNWDNVTYTERNELVFENRNKDFGAYQIRKNYTRTVFIAFIIAISAVLIGLSIPLISNMFSEMIADNTIKMSDEIELMEPPPIDETAPPPPPVIPPPPVVETIKFTPPKVVEDEEVPEDAPPPTQEELQESNAGVVTQEGDSGAVDLPPENPVVGDPDEGKIFTIVEEMPQFPGGEGALVKYLQDNIKYPPIARENGITGIVFLTFLVNKEGKISDVKVLKGIGGGCDQEAIRVVKSMPTWKIGKQNGRPVAVQYNLPVRFSLK